MHLHTTLQRVNTSTTEQVTDLSAGNVWNTIPVILWGTKCGDLQYADELNEVFLQNISCMRTEISRYSDKCWLNTMEDRQKVSAVFLVANDMSLRVCNTATGYVMCEDTDGLTVLYVCKLQSSKAHGCNMQQRNNRHLWHCYSNLCTFMCSIRRQCCFSEQYKWVHRNIQERLGKCEWCQVLRIPLSINHHWETARSHSHGSKGWNLLSQKQHKN